MVLCVTCGFSVISKTFWIFKGLIGIYIHLSTKNTYYSVLTNMLIRNRYVSWFLKQNILHTFSYSFTSMAGHRINFVCYQEKSSAHCVWKILMNMLICGRAEKRLCIHTSKQMTGIHTFQGSVLKDVWLVVCPKINPSACIFELRCSKYKVTHWPAIH